MGLSRLRMMGIAALLAAASAAVVVSQRPVDISGDVIAPPGSEGAASTSIAVNSSAYAASPSAYAVSLSFKEILDFPGTNFAFRGKVTNILAPRYVAIENSRMEYVYTPVVVDISAMYRGARPDDGKMILRIMGGTTGGVPYAPDFARSDKVLNQGDQLIVLGAGSVAVPGDGGLVALTPGGLYIVNGNRLVDVTRGHYAQQQTHISLRQAEAWLAGSE